MTPKDILAENLAYLVIVCTVLFNKKKLDIYKTKGEVAGLKKNQNDLNDP